MNNVLRAGYFIPVNLHDYEVLIRAELQRADDVRDDFGSSLPAMIPWNHFSDKPDIYPTAPISEEDIQRYEALIYNTTQLSGIPSAPISPETRPWMKPSSCLTTGWGCM